jgi:hypothetical protein
MMMIRMRIRIVLFVYNGPLWQIFKLRRIFLMSQNNHSAKNGPLTASELYARVKRPGFTLADARGPSRIRRLEDAKLDLQIQVIQKLDQIQVIEHELEEIAIRARWEQEKQTPIIDPVMPVHWRRLSDVL